MKPQPLTTRGQGKTIISIVLLACLFAVVVGCRTRCDYRHWADDEVSQALRDKQCDPRWHLPARTVEPDSRSRMADWTCPDCGPLPPDDPAAHCFMEFPDRFHGWPFWRDCGDLPHVESPDWQQYLPMDETGVVKLNRETAVELSRLHSRQYQDQVELLYFTALAFTLDRFEFTTQWFFRSGQVFDAAGTGPNESRVFTTRRNAGFRQNLTIGGQLLVDFANSFVWEFAGSTVSSASSGILVSLTQPLLRGAFREVRLESLTQAERDLLYGVRDFARFRRAFYVDIVGDGYLPLLAVAQSIKNQEKNLESLERNLQEHEQLSRAGLAAPIQVDQVFQSYQEGRLNLLSSRQALQNALDRFKLSLGLPPQLSIVLDEEVLRPFELNNPKTEALQAANEATRLALIQADESVQLDELKQNYARLKTQQDEMVEVKKQVHEEFRQWDKRLRASVTRIDEANEDDRQRLQRERELAERLEEALEELDEMVEVDLRRVAAGAEGKWLPPPDDETDELDGEAGGDQRDRNQGDRDSRSGNRLPILRFVGWQDSAQQTAEESVGKDDRQADEQDGDETGPSQDVRTKLWESLKELVGSRFRKQLEDLFVIQAQIRVYLIESTPTEIDQESAIQTALGSRLDLMNARGNVVDAYRRVEVAADGLEADLNLQLEANLGTDPGRINPVRFDASANRYRVGVEFDSPVTRLAERNAYRAAQINYQQTRRAYMALKDSIVADVRRDIRRLEFEKFSFEIARIQLLTAARQVDEAQLTVRTTTDPDASSTQNLLSALQRLLGSKNSLISSWVSYEASRMALYRDLEQMQIAPDGTWINESPDQSADNLSGSQDGLSALEPFEGNTDGTGRFDNDQFERQYIDEGPGDETAIESSSDQPFQSDAFLGDPGFVEPAPREPLSAPAP